MLTTQKTWIISLLGVVIEGNIFLKTQIVSFCFVFNTVWWLCFHHCFYTKAMFIAIQNVSLRIKLLILSAFPFSLHKSRLPTYLLDSLFHSLRFLNSQSLQSVIAVQRSCPAGSPTPSPGYLPLLPSIGCFLLNWDTWEWWLHFSHLSEPGLHCLCLDLSIALDWSSYYCLSPQKVSHFGGDSWAFCSAQHSQQKLLFCSLEYLRDLNQR